MKRAAMVSHKKWAMLVSTPLKNSRGNAFAHSSGIHQAGDKK